MASRSVPIPIPQTRSATRLRLVTQPSTLRIAFILFVVLLILFGWLHLIMAMHIASTSRQIQVQEQVREKLGRDKAALLQQIAEKEAPKNMEMRAQEKGYVRPDPVYLRVPGAVAPAANDGSGLAPSSAPSAAETEAASSTGRSLLNSVLGQLGAWAEAEQ